MKYPLYGNELSDETNPLEAGLGWVTKFDKGDFVGKAPIARAKEAGMKRKLVGFRMTGRGIARHGYPVFNADGTQQVGEVTSGTQSPCLKESIGVAYVPVELSAEGSRFTVDIRGQKIPAEVIPTPFYKRSY
jgi:aminomethyltransferase